MSRLHVDAQQDRRRPGGVGAQFSHPFRRLPIRHPWVGQAAQGECRRIRACRDLVVGRVAGDQVVGGGIGAADCPIPAILAASAAGSCPTSCSARRRTAPPPRPLPTARGACSAPRPPAARPPNRHRRRSARPSRARRPPDGRRRPRSRRTLLGLAAPRPSRNQPQPFSEPPRTWAVAQIQPRSTRPSAWSEKCGMVEWP